MVTSREFYYLVAQMRAAQREYIKKRDPRVLRACKYLETQVDNAITESRESWDRITEQLKATNRCL